MHFLTSTPPHCASHSTSFLAQSCFSQDLIGRDHVAAPAVDIYAGSFPCQPLSSQGAGKGAEDVRSLLWMEGLVYVEHHRPKCVIFETVPGMLFQKHRPYLDVIRQSLRDANYRVHIRVLNSLSFQLPQHRRRVWIVALQREALGDRKFEWPPDMPPVRARDFLEAAVPTSEPSQGPTTDKQVGKLAAGLLAIQAKGGCPDRQLYFVDFRASPRYGPTWRRSASPCLTRSRAGAGGYWISTLARTMTTREILRFQGFRDGLLRRKGISRTAVRQAMGNAWSLPVAAAVLKQCCLALGIQCL